MRARANRCWHFNKPVSVHFDTSFIQTYFHTSSATLIKFSPKTPRTTSSLWPRSGTNWHKAVEICQYLSEDGLSLASTPQQIWRLPTVDEAVRSMSRHGQNSQGIWDADMSQATYKITPDKESPLWNIHSQVIYWWTATEIDEERAYIIVYDGKVWPRSKQFGAAYLGFRCVKEP